MRTGLNAVPLIVSTDRLADAGASVEIYIGMDKPDLGNSARSSGSQRLL